MGGILTDGSSVSRLSEYLAASLPIFSEPYTVKEFSDGQSNPTYLLTAGNQKYVLRCKPPGQLLKSAHAVDREFRVMSALKNTNVPVPRTYVLCEDPGIIGSVFFIMEYADGRIFWDPALPDINRKSRTDFFDEMNTVLANLHKVNVNEVGLGDYGRPGNYYQRQFSRWLQQYRSSETRTIEAMDALIDWLADNIPADDGLVSLVHGDYRLDNMIFHHTEPRIIAVLDWELSTLGHPFADLAYQCMQWRLPNKGILSGLGGIDLISQGLPNEQEYVASYCKNLNIGDIPNWTFYLAFGCFRFAAIVQGVLKRALDGNASSGKAIEVGRLAQPLAEMAVNIIEQDKQVPS